MQLKQLWGVAVFALLVASCDESSNARNTDDDGDGYSEFDGDCDDNDPSIGPIDLDGDCDGVTTNLDCDDSDPSLLAVADDGDCDGSRTRRTLPGPWRTSRGGSAPVPRRCPVLRRR